MKNILFVSFIILSMSMLGMAPRIKVGSKPPSDFLLSHSDPTNDPFYKRVLSSVGESREKVKIQYLIARIRKSSYSFVRNGAPYPPGRAATHMAWKLSRKGKDIKTAKDFIENIGTRSSMSGEHYLIKTTSGETYYVSDVLWNELNWLEKNIAEHQSSSSQ